MQILPLNYLFCCVPGAVINCSLTSFQPKRSFLLSWQMFYVRISVLTVGESLCLSHTSEICAIGSGCAENIFYGRGYIQLTGQANYQAYANFIKRQDIMTNPNLVAQNQAMAWGSALYFWQSIGKCRGSFDAGTALLCISNVLLTDVF